MIHRRYGIIQDAVYLSKYLSIELGLFISTPTLSTHRVAFDCDQLLHHPRIIVSCHILELPGPSQFALDIK